MTFEEAQAESWKGYWVKCQEHVDYKKLDNDFLDAGWRLNIELAYKAGFAASRRLSIENSKQDGAE